MLKTIIIFSILVILSIRFINHIQSNNTQFTFLKTSPEIERKENLAIKFIIVLMIVFVLLAITALF
jgi:hypothetical protein